MLFTDSINAHSLRICLQIAVPLWGDRIAAYSDEVCLARASAAGKVIAAYGDVLMFGHGRSKRARGRARSLIDLWLEKEDESATREDDWVFKPSPSSGEVLNVLAEAVALLERLGGVDDVVDKLFDGPA